MILDRILRRKKKEEIELPPEIPTALPEDLERFKIRPESREYPSLPFEKTPEPIARSENDKIELIIQKLETIDARLRFIEERLKRY